LLQSVPENFTIAVKMTIRTINPDSALWSDFNHFVMDTRRTRQHAGNGSMKTDILREIIPLTRNDCFTIFTRTKTRFDFPLHYHDEMELNLVLNARGAQRIIGDHIGDIGDAELVLVGPNLPHAWFTHTCRSKRITEVTIQFHRDLFDGQLLHRNQLAFIKTLMEQSGRGILFSPKTARDIAERILSLSGRQGFDSVLELMRILHDLSTSPNRKILSDAGFLLQDSGISFQSRRVEKVMKYLNQHYQDEIPLADAAAIASMTEVAFSRFFKRKTGHTYVDTLNEIRLGHASRLLIDTSHSVAEIAYQCGFNNLSHFNRLFRKKKQCTPSGFRSTYSATGVRTFI
jgi:AraC-like DNA-binding protein